MEIGTGLYMLGTAPLVNKLLGPTADYFGKEIESWTKRRVENVKRVIDNAINKVGKEIDEDGQIPPRVFKGLMEEGSFCEDVLSTEYFGGVLAYSRSQFKRNDLGATLISLLGRLSVYDLRTHFLCYHLVKRLYEGKYFNFADILHKDRALTVYVPIEAYQTAMAFEGGEKLKVYQILEHAMFGLDRENLIELCAFGQRQHLSRFYYGDTSHPLGDGFVFKATGYGVELFLAAYGRHDVTIHDFLLPNCRFPLVNGIVIPDGALRIGG